MTKIKGNKEELSYQVWLPEGQEPDPLVVLLPEAKEKAVSEHLAEFFLQEETQRQYPCGVLLPQPARWDDWGAARSLQSLLFEWEAQGKIDGCRIYLIGGSGAWSVGSRFPRRFAATAALSGWGDPYAARNLKFTPVRVFSALEDPEVPASAVRRTDGKLLASGRRLAMALRTCGSQVSSYQELPGDAPGLWKTVFSGNLVEETLRWLFGQTRKTQYEVTFLQPGLFRIDDYFTSSCYLVAGTEKALLIDTGMGEGDLPALARSLTPLPVETAITHPHRDHIFQAEKFDRVYLHEQDVEKLAEYEEQMKGFFAKDGPSMPTREKIVPIRDGSKIDLGGVVVETKELGGHTEHSVVFVDDFHRAVFTGDAVGSGYIVLMICAVSQWKKVIGQFRENLIAFQPVLPRLTDYGWYGGHFIQENGCNVEKQEYYLSGRSDYFCPISREIAEDMVGLCDQLLDGTITEEELLSSPEHHASYRTAGVNFRFLNE